MAAISTLQIRFVFLQPAICNPNLRVSSNVLEVRTKIQLNSCYLNWSPRKLDKNFPARIVSCSVNSNGKRVGNEVNMEKDLVSRFRETISTLPPVTFAIKRYSGTNFAFGLCLALALLMIAVRAYVARKSSYNHHGSVADLVKRGQLRSDRRGISTPLKYDDPFNNPLVKIGKSNSTVEMCGKVYRLAPVTLTEEEQSSHQKRRSRAYQWKRPTMFVKEGESIPPDVDPDTVRWIPTNHPFATTTSDIDEDLAQNNVYQKHGVPFRIQAEHEALQRKLETLQSEQKLGKLVIDPASARDFERPFKSHSESHKQEEKKPSTDQGSNSSTPKSYRSPNSFETNTASEELHKP